MLGLLGVVLSERHQERRHDQHQHHESDAGGHEGFRHVHLAVSHMRLPSATMPGFCLAMLQQAEDHLNP